MAFIISRWDQPFFSTCWKSSLVTRVLYTADAVSGLIPIGNALPEGPPHDEPPADDAPPLPEELGNIDAAMMHKKVNKMTLARGKERRERRRFRV